MRHLTFSAAAILIFASHASLAQDSAMALVPFELTGNVTSEGWDDLSGLSNNGFGTWPGTRAWPRAIMSQTGTDPGNAGLHRLAGGVNGGPYPASGSIYFAGTGHGADLDPDAGHLAVKDLTPLGNLKTVVLQLQLGVGIWGTLKWDENGTAVFGQDDDPGYPVEAGTGQSKAWYNREFWKGIYPVLIYTYDQGGQTVTVEQPPTHSSWIESFGGGVAHGEALAVNTWGFQWNLSDAPQPITSISMSFRGSQHATLYEIYLQQNDEITPSSVLPPTLLPDEPEYFNVTAVPTNNPEDPTERELVFPTVPRGVYTPQVSLTLAEDSWKSMTQLQASGAELRVKVHQNPDTPTRFWRIRRDH